MDVEYPEKHAIIASSRFPNRAANKPARVTRPAFLATTRPGLPEFIGEKVEMLTISEESPVFIGS
jgi:hypothetical protein